MTDSFFRSLDNALADRSTFKHDPWAEYFDGLCPACAAGSHTFHIPSLGDVCIGCTCYPRP